MNNIVVSGYLGKEARTKVVTARGKEQFVVNFNLAVNDGKKNGEKQTIWISVVGWGSFFEGVSEYLKKGTYVMVTGRAGLEAARDDYPARLQVTAQNIELGPSNKQEDAEEEEETTSDVAEEDAAF
jgi:single-stranded DNA-binding protein